MRPYLKAVALVVTYIAFWAVVLAGVIALALLAPVVSIALPVVLFFVVFVILVRDEFF